MQFGISLAMSDASNKIESAYTAIREGIVKGDFAPGQRLVIRSLGVRLGMSTVPIREALRRLEAEGWVTFERNIGAQVRPVDASEYVAVMDTLAWVEGHATALAAPLLTSEDLAAAREHNEEMRTAIGGFDPVAASRANLAFHEVLRSRCPNRYLNGVVETASERVAAMLRTVFVFVPIRTLAAVEEHEHLLGLIELGADSDAIERYAREHKLRTVAAYLARAEGIDAEEIVSPEALVHRALAQSRPLVLDA
jgi:DNA-binding GntR family transcriptional regulator